MCCFQFQGTIPKVTPYIEDQAGVCTEGDMAICLTATVLAFTLHPTSNKKEIPQQVMLARTSE